MREKILIVDDEKSNLKLLVSLLVLLEVCVLRKDIASAPLMVICFGPAFIGGQDHDILFEQ